MKTRNMVLAGLGLAAAGAAYFLFRTDRGKKVRHGLADNISGWRDSLMKLAASDGDGLAHAEAHKTNAARHLKSMPHK